MISVASRPRVKRHRSISVDDRKYFDQYRAFRPNLLVRLSILAPSTGRDRKRSDIALQTSDRRSQRQNFEQKVTARRSRNHIWRLYRRIGVSAYRRVGGVKPLSPERNPRENARSSTSALQG